MKRLWILLMVAGILLIIYSLPLIELYLYHRHDIRPVINNPPKKIITLSPNLTEIVFALGLGDKVVAVSNDCDWPWEAKMKSKVGSFWQPNTEAIIAIKPDLVVCESFPQQKEVAESLKRARLNVLSLRIETINELFSATSQISEAAGCPNKGKQLATDINDQLNQIRAKSASVKKVKVLWAVQTEPMRVVGVKTFVNEIIELAGGQNVIAPTGDQYPSVGTEAILTCGAEVIIQSAMGDEDITKQQKTAEKFWNRFANLPAVKNKKVYVINSDTVLRLGPRLPEGAMSVANLLHPELFSQPKDPNQSREGHQTVGTKRIND